ALGINPAWQLASGEAWLWAAGLRSLLPQDHVHCPTPLRMPGLLQEVLGRLSVARFEQRIVQGEGAVLAGVERLRELYDGRGQMRSSLATVLSFFTLPVFSVEAGSNNKT